MASLKDKLRAKQRAAREARMMRRHVPLFAFYGRERAHEHARNLFYDRCAKIFEWPDWEFSGIEDDTGDLYIARVMRGEWNLPAHGNGGRGREIAAIERARVIAIDLSAAPFEWLASHNRLETKHDSSGMGNVRFSAGIKLRDLFIGAEPAGLKSANLEGGSGGGTPVLISDFKFDCVTSLARLREQMAQMVPLRWSKIKYRDEKGEEFEEQAYAFRSEPLRVLEQLVYKDVWIFDGLPQAKQKAVMDQIHNGLDQVSLFFGMITPREYAARWKPKADRKDAGRQGSSETAR
jgi:hypothetical protein